MARIRCSVGIMAHNEGSNIGRLLHSIVEQSLHSVEISQIIVVASGCTDNTETIVRQWEEKDSRIRAIVQSRREGKASAINLFLAAAHEEIMVLSSADLLPDAGTIEAIVAPFTDAEIGMTTSRPVPVNDDRTFMGYAAHLLWGLHHQINLTGFKAGEMIAFRKVFSRIPYHTSVDEASMEPLIRGQGYKVKYIPEALVYNKGPETVKDFLKQRRRIYSGHLAIRDEIGYTVSTLGASRIFRLLVRNLDIRPRQFAWTWIIVGLEAYSRFLGVRDYKAHRDHSVWEIAETTKRLQYPA